MYVSKMTTLKILTNVRYINNGRLDLVLLQEVADNIVLAGCATVYGYLQKQLQSEYYFSGKTVHHTAHHDQFFRGIGSQYY